MSEGEGDCKFLSGFFYRLAVKSLEVEAFLVDKARYAYSFGELAVD